MLFVLFLIPHRRRRNDETTAPLEKNNNSSFFPSLASLFSRCASVPALRCTINQLLALRNWTGGKLGILSPRSPLHQRDNDSARPGHQLPNPHPESLFAKKYKIGQSELRWHFLVSRELNHSEF